MLNVPSRLLTSEQDKTKGARITKLEDYEKCLDYFQQQGVSSKTIRTPHPPF